MAVPMDNSSDQSSTERVQHLLDKTVELDNKRKQAVQARVPSDPNIWQQIRENYETIILENHSFSEQHEIEFTLWQLHYRRIEELRAHLIAAQNSKVGPTRERIIKIRVQFKNFVSEATGFYHDLMLKIRAKYGSGLSCHRCFIYLGDLARYKGLYGENDSKTRDFATASSYYTQACSILPSSGNPHNQLAILASYSGDELLAVYRYFRSLAVETPFITARDNLIMAFEKNRQSYSLLLGEAKPSGPKVVTKGRGKNDSRVPQKNNRTMVNNTVKEKTLSVPEIFKAFSTKFVRLNGILFTRTSLETFEEVLTMVKNDLTELLSSGPELDCNFGSDTNECKLMIIRLVSILIFTVHNAMNIETENKLVLLQNSSTFIFEFMGLILERCVKLTNPWVSFLLPGVMIFLEWLAIVSHQDVTVDETLLVKCVNLLNKLLLVDIKDEAEFKNEGEMGNCVALFEDFELRGFLPIVSKQDGFDFTRKLSESGSHEKKVRFNRIVEGGKAIKGVYFDVKMKKFVIGEEPIDNNCVEVLELNGVKQFSPVEEDEDEEEIVFKPLVIEKQFNGPTKVEEAVITNGVGNLKLLENGGPIMQYKTPAPISVPFPQSIPGLKKNPVSRPVRQTGPPPGFGFSAPYQFPSSVNGSHNSVNWSHNSVNGFHNTVNGSYSSVNGSYSSVNGFHSSVNGSHKEMLNFPFPGKTSSVVAPPHQQQYHQGQSLWEGRYFV